MLSGLRIRSGPQWLALLDLSSIKALEDIESDIRRAKSFAGELRHLAALMNHEKY